MKMYCINNRFYATQSDAKPALTALGIKHASIGDFETDVPTTKDDLIAYLNNMLENNSVNDTIVEERTGAAPVAEPEREVGMVPEMAAPYGDTPAPLERAVRAINVEDEIAAADFPNALRLAEHATARVAEHLKMIKNEAARQSAEDLL